MTKIKESNTQHRECDINYIIEEDEGKYFVEMWVTVKREGKAQKNKLGFEDGFLSQFEAENAAIQVARDFIDKNLSP